MLDQPDETVLQRALQLAQQHGRPMYVYQDARDWKIAAKIAETNTSSRIIEVSPELLRSETQNLGGC